MLALLLSVIPYRGRHSNHDEFIPVSSVEHRPLDDVINDLHGHESGFRQCLECQCCAADDPSFCLTMSCCQVLVCLEPGRLCSLKVIGCDCRDC
ncbi:hypothetical protein MUK42_36169 [Musa troglodytarum]|uniref:Uncharacterized protein n=1 Tax=Musa troglodytarum TaxID=320322 RepID=A0A9E7HBE7_9LILI|nr:hypothetical protein MUK42_36169 [Musa troglodytarum]